MSALLLAVVLAAAPAAKSKPGVAWSPSEAKDALLRKTKEAMTALEFRDAEAISAALLAREDLTLDERIDVQLVRGTVLAVIADPTDAEPMFRLVLRARPEFDLPDDTPPRVMAVFRKVQVEERRAADQLRAIERQRRIKGIEFVYQRPTSVEGGVPLEVAIRVRDATGAVERVRLGWRVKQDADFAMLPLKRRADGAWSAELPASATASEGGQQLDYFFESLDREGPLRLEASKLAPLQLRLEPGALQVAPPVPRGVFFVAGGTTLLSAIAAAMLWLAVSIESTNLASTTSISASELRRAQRQGGDLTAGAVGVSIGALVALTTTLVLAPLTDFAGPRPVVSPFTPPEAAVTP